MQHDETIAAISTALGEGGIGIVRLSGQKTFEIADRVFQSRKKLAPSRQKVFTSQLGFFCGPRECRGRPSG